jgi:hydrogenase maturation protease
VTAAGTARDVLVVGLGHPDRGDDAAGLVIARRVREQVPAVPVVEWEGEMSGLLDLWGGVGTVVVVDAVRGGPPGRVLRLGDGGAALPPGTGRGTHDLDLDDVVRLARVLGRAPRRLVVIGVTGTDFGAGRPLSTEVAEAIETATRAVLAELGREPSSLSDDAERGR